MSHWWTMKWFMGGQWMILGWALGRPGVGHGWALGHGPQVMKSKLCPEFVHIHCLSRVCPCPMSVQSLSKPLKETPPATKNVSFVHRLFTSNICPDLVQYWNLKFLSSFYWSKVGFLCPISVQEPLSWTGPLQTLDRLCIIHEIGQTLDRVWTEIGFCVQSLSNQPKLRSTGKPYAYSTVVVFLWLMSNLKFALFAIISYDNN